MVKPQVLRLIAGFETADNGQITIDGKDVTDIPAEQRLVNTVFQELCTVSTYDSV